MCCFSLICGLKKKVTSSSGSQSREIDLEYSWKSRLRTEFEKGYMEKLRSFLIQEKKLGKKIYPPSHYIFNALNSTPFETTKAVILGQDPYHGPGQAHGLSFSVIRGVDIPPSLKNIFKELEVDVDFRHPEHGSLNYWASQGVLLLNSILTVEHGKAGSHQRRGWEEFTDRVIELLNLERHGIAFLLWGAYAQKKGEFIDREKHLVLKSPHPSPFSAHKGFFGGRHFSKVNEYLVNQNKSPIDWQIPDHFEE